MLLRPSSDFFCKTSLRFVIYFVIGIKPVSGNNFKPSFLKSILYCLKESGIHLSGTGSSFYRLTHTVTIQCNLSRLAKGEIAVLLEKYCTLRKKRPQYIQMLLFVFLKFHKACSPFCKSSFTADILSKVLWGIFQNSG